MRTKVKETAFSMKGRTMTVIALDPASPLQDKTYPETNTGRKLCTYLTKDAGFLCSRSVIVSEGCCIQPCEELA
jgi:hypothetical protein